MRKNLNEASTRSRQNKRGGGGRARRLCFAKNGNGAVGDEPAQTTAEKRQVQLDNVAQQFEKMARDLESGDGQWNVEDWLFSQGKGDEREALCSRRDRELFTGAAYVGQSPRSNT